MSSRSVMERNTVYICTCFRKEDVVRTTCVVWWLVEDSKDKHDKLAVPLGLLGLSSWCIADSSILWHTAIEAKARMCKTHLCDIDLEHWGRWVHPRKKRMEREQEKMWWRNSPWYSLKFSTTVTPPTQIYPPSLFLFLLHPSVPTANVLPCCLPICCLDCPWSFWWIHKTSCILDWDGAVGKTSMMARRKVISTSWGKGMRWLWGRWRSECVWEWWDAEITTERGKGWGLQLWASQY